MLAAPLLRVTVRKGTIMPLFCTRNDELELAERILEEFQASFRLHERKSELNDRISAIESSNQTDYKLVRGLCALLERRCVFSASTSSNSHFGINSSSNSTLSFKNNDNDEEDARAANSQLDINKSATAMTVIDPIDVRRMLFEESSKRGFALTELERENIINFAAEKLRVSSNDIKSAMWSDMDDNLVFQDFDYIDVKTLVGWYNLSLMQTLLFNATKMEFHVSGGTNWKHVLRNVKRLGLMYYLENRNSSSSSHQQHQPPRESQKVRDNEAWKGNNNINNNDNDDDNSFFLVCSLEGPLSLFKLTDRYGTSLAKLIPSIVLLPKEEDRQRHHHVTWQIDAWILRKTMMQGKKLYQFKISSEDDALPYLADPLYAPASVSAAVAANNETNEGHQKARSPSASSSFSSADTFDSLVEEKFARKFNEVVSEESGWKLVREPDPLILADGKAFIPDFMFEKYGKRVYLEIVGFWTPEYLERKLQKVKQLIQASSGINSSSSTSVSSNKTAVVDLFIAINEELAGARVYSSSHHPPPSSSTSSAATTTTTTTTTFSSSVPADRLIFYKNDSVPIRPILEYLKARDKEMIDKKLSDPNLRIAIDRSKDIISIEDLADQYNLPVEVVSKIASRDFGDQYISIDGGSSGAMSGVENNEQRRSSRYLLISKDKASRLESQLSKVNNFTDACAILSKHDVPESCHAALVDMLGYEVVWQSMDISTATIKKRKKS